MNRSKWKQLLFSENSLLIWVPATVVVLLLTAFFIYGLQRPDRIEVSQSTTLLAEQTIQSTAILNEYDAGNYTPSSPLLVQDPFGVSPLTAVLLFESTQDTSYLITIDGKDEEADLQYPSSKGTIHTIPIYGLYPDYTNTVRIHEYNDITQEIGNPVTTLSLRTEPLPDTVLLPTSLDTTEAYFGTDWMVLMPAEDNFPQAIDAYGNVRWYLTLPIHFAIKPLANGHFLVGGDRPLHPPYSMTSLYEIDLLGQIYTSFVIPGGVHHDFVELDNGNILVLSNDFDGTIDDHVVELSRTSGLVVQAWDLADLIDPTEGRNPLASDMDWFHATAIDYHAGTDSILVTGRNQDIIVNFDRATGQLNYLFGDPDGWPLTTVFNDFIAQPQATPNWFYAPYHATFAPGGDLFVFDNGLLRSKSPESYLDAVDSFSQGILYDVDTVLNRASVIESYGMSRDSGFFSPYLSNVDYYGTRHYLIHSGGITMTESGPLAIPPILYEGEDDLILRSITVELEDGFKQYELKMDAHYNRAIRLDPTEYPHVQIRMPRVLGLPNQTATVAGSVDSAITVFRQIRPEVDLNFVQEPDRLVMRGRFDLEDEVYLELVNDNGVKRYVVPTATMSCVELCLIPDEDHVTFYLNQAGLLGTYDLYVRVNGHRYDTLHYVVFD